MSRVVSKASDVVEDDIGGSQTCRRRWLMAHRLSMSSRGDVRALSGLGEGQASLVGLR